MSTHGRLALDPDAARALDAAARSRFGIPGLLLMEHAALGVASIVEDTCRRRGLDGILVACGPGGNGGDGWAVARMLALRGRDVEVVSIASCTPGSDAEVNERIARRLAGTNLRIHDVGPTTLETGDIARKFADRVVVDGLFGVGLARPIAGAAAGLIDAIASSRAPVVSIDLPSGLDAATGRPTGPCVRATVTATMVAPKTGMCLPEATPWTGAIRVVDIGTPPSLLREFGRVAGSAPVGDDADIRPADVPR